MGSHSLPENIISKEEKRRDGDEGIEKLPGFRFHPTDEELVSFYLRLKLENKPLNLIKEVEIYKYDPWDLPKTNVGDKELFFFCMRGRKYRNSVRPNRVTGSGFWKATGIDKPINAGKEPQKCIGLKKSLVYYRGHAGKGTKTDWMMHEFRMPTRDIAPQAEVWTLCRIFQRIPSSKKSTPDSSQQTTPTARPMKKSPTMDSCISCCLDSECIDSRRIEDWNSNSLLLQDDSNFWNLNQEDLMGYGNCWDGVRSVGDVDYHTNFLPDRDFE